MCRMSDRPYRERLGAVVPVIALVVLAACASRGAASGAALSTGDSSAEASGAPSHVVVHNQSWDRVTVYISEGAMVWRLGDVEAKSERTLSVKNFGKALLGRTAHFIGRPLAGAAFARSRSR